MIKLKQIVLQNDNEVFNIYVKNTSNLCLSVTMLRETLLGTMRPYLLEVQKSEESLQMTQCPDLHI